MFDLKKKVSNLAQHTRFCDYCCCCCVSCFVCRLTKESDKLFLKD